MIGHFAQLTKLNAAEFKEAMTLLENDVRQSYENLWLFVHICG